MQRSKGSIRPGSVTAIYDGYTFWGYVNGVKNEFGPLRFDWRPAMKDARRELYSRTSRIDLDTTSGMNEQDRLTAEMVVEHVKWWDVQGRDGVLPLNAESVNKLPDEMASALFKIITCQQASDIDPAWPNDGVEIPPKTFDESVDEGN